tara:strand:- start:2738 stop:3238 length:501 start_codon:yes stop_codon:yes gene_type:complete
MSGLKPYIVNTALGAIIIAWAAWSFSQQAQISDLKAENNALAGTVGALDDLVRNLSITVGAMRENQGDFKDFVLPRLYPQVATKPLDIPHVPWDTPEESAEPADAESVAEDPVPIPKKPESPKEEPERPRSRPRTDARDKPVKTEPWTRERSELYLEQQQMIQRAK